jgi:hypothetical protein
MHGLCGLANHNAITNGDLWQDLPDAALSQLLDVEGGSQSPKDDHASRHLHSQVPNTPTGSVVNLLGEDFVQRFRHSAHDRGGSVFEMGDLLNL